MSHHGQVEAADALVSAGNPAAAKRILSKVLDDNPDHKDALTLLAFVEELSGHPDRTLDICRQLVALYADDETVRVHLVCHLAKLKNHQEARAAFEMFTRDFPASSHIDSLATVVHSHRGDVNALRDDVAKMRAAQGDRPHINMLEGLVAEADGSDADAFAASQRVLIHEPTHARAHLLAARTAFRLFWLPSAHRHASAALRTDGKSVGMRGIRRMSIACILPPVLLACGILRFAGWLSPGSVPSLNFRLLIGVFLFAVIGIGLEAVGIPRGVAFAGFAVSVLYILVESFVVTEREEKRDPESVELRDY